MPDDFILKRLQGSCLFGECFRPAQLREDRRVLRAGHGGIGCRGLSDRVLVSLPC